MAATAAATVRELGQLRVDALRDACQNQGLPANGRKDQLMARLIEADKARLRPSQKPEKKQDVACPIKTDKVECHGRCPAGHALVPFTTPVAACGCDKCSKVFPKGAQLHSCRKCNYDECSDCLIKAQSSRKLETQGAGKKVVNGKPADTGIRSAAPRSPKNAGTSSSSQTRNHWMKSPLAKGRFESPRRDCQPQSPGGMVRRRIREKSPNPHRDAVDWRDELGFMGSPACRQTGLSPNPLGPRRRIREKSPDPHRNVDWRHELGFFGSPAALHEGTQVGKRRQERSPNPHASRQDKSPNPNASTPGKRLRVKTPEWQVAEWQVVLHQNETLTSSAAACSKTPVDPVQALLLLSRRELLEMCVDWGVSIIGAKSVLIDRLVDAHRRPRAVSPEPEVCLAIAEKSIAEKPDAILNAHAPASNMRMVPPPPSSWTAPPLPSSWTSLQVCEPSADSELTSSSKAAEPESSVLPSQASQPQGLAESAVPTLPARLESVVGGSPTPARLTSGASSPVKCGTEKAAIDTTPEVVETSKEVATAVEIPPADISSDPADTLKASSAETSSMSSTATSNDWWRNVASRWPTIVANLKAGAGGQKDAAPSSPERSPRKRSLGSPSILEGFQSPKRHCSALSGAGGSPTAPF